MGRLLQGLHFPKAKNRRAEKLMINSSLFIGSLFNERKKLDKFFSSYREMDVENRDPETEKQPEIKRMSAEINRKISDKFSGGLNQLVQVGPQRMVVPSKYRDLPPYFKNFEFRTSDVVVAGFPRSGTTMTQELLWLLFNEFNFKVAAQTSLVQRVPLLEARCLTEDVKSECVDRTRQYLRPLENLQGMTNRRVLKTHIHLNLLPQKIFQNKCKVIYVARNPKDVMVSMYHLQRSAIGRKYLGTFPEFVQLFLNDHTLFAPYWAHVQYGWQYRSHRNVFFLFYENFVKDRRNTIRKILEFVEESVTPFHLDLLDFVLEFDNFKKYMAQGVDKDMNDKKQEDDNFIRRGRGGEWGDLCPPGGLTRRVEEWIEENSRKIGIEFPKF